MPVICVGRYDKLSYYMYSKAITQVTWNTIAGAQVGHQAAQCTNGTINWKGIYGDDAFVLKEPLYHSDYSRIAKEKQVDLTALEARAQQYAKVHVGCCMFILDICLLSRLYVASGQMRGCWHGL